MSSEYVIGSRPNRRVGHSSRNRLLGAVAVATVAYAAKKAVKYAHERGLLDGNHAGPELIKLAMSETALTAEAVEVPDESVDTSGDVLTTAVTEDLQPEPMTTISTATGLAELEFDGPPGALAVTSLETVSGAGNTEPTIVEPIVELSVDEWGYEKRPTLVSVELDEAATSPVAVAEPVTEPITAAVVELGVAEPEINPEVEKAIKKANFALYDLGYETDGHPQSDDCIRLWLAHNDFVPNKNETHQLLIARLTWLYGPHYNLLTETDPTTDDQAYKALQTIVENKYGRIIVDVINRINNSWRLKSSNFAKLFDEERLTAGLTDPMKYLLEPHNGEASLLRDDADEIPVTEPRVSIRSTARSLVGMQNGFDEKPPVSPVDELAPRTWNPSRRVVALGLTACALLTGGGLLGGFGKSHSITNNFRNNAPKVESTVRQTPSWLQANIPAATHAAASEQDRLTASTESRARRFLASARQLVN